MSLIKQRMMAFESSAKNARVPDEESVAGASIPETNRHSGGKSGRSSESIPQSTAAAAAAADDDDDNDDRNNVVESQEVQKSGRVSSGFKVGGKSSRSSESVPQSTAAAVPGSISTNEVPTTRSIALASGREQRGDGDGITTEKLPSKVGQYQLSNDGDASPSIKPSSHLNERGLKVSFPHSNDFCTPVISSYSNDVFAAPPVPLAGHDCHARDQAKAAISTKVARPYRRGRSACPGSKAWCPGPHRRNGSSHGQIALNDSSTQVYRER